MPITESAPSRKQEAKSAGATGWSVKPVNPAALVGVLRQGLAARSGLRNLNGQAPFSRGVKMPI